MYLIYQQYDNHVTEAMDLNDIPVSDLPLDVSLHTSGTRITLTDFLTYLLQYCLDKVKQYWWGYFVFCSLHRKNNNNTFGTGI